MIQSSSSTGRLALQRAIVSAIAYADVFDYPLTVHELHRYLIGVQADSAAVEDALDGLPGVSRTGRYITFAGREAIVQIRTRRTAVADRQWPKALRYGRRLARVPFVRMVALTGALAMDNVEQDGDIDFLIVTAPGRLWLCRALIISLVRMARLAGDEVCPNYLVSEDALTLPDRNLFAAHEMAQMVPLAGLAVYDKMRRLNSWSTEYLPNAIGVPRAISLPVRKPSKTLERVMRSSLGGALERWEMDRKIKRYRALDHAETSFSPDWCKGHFDGHGEATLAAYSKRLAALDLA